MPLRVPMVALTDALCGYRFELGCIEGLSPRCHLRGMVLQMHYIYHRCRYYQLQVSKYYAYSY